MHGNIDEPRRNKFRPRQLKKLLPGEPPGLPRCCGGGNT